VGYNQSIPEFYNVGRSWALHHPEQNHSESSRIHALGNAKFLLSILHCSLIYHCWDKAFCVVFRLRGCVSSQLMSFLLHCM